MSSIADKAIEALSMVAAIGQDMTNEDPTRHLVRTAKRMAEQDLEACFLRVVNLAYHAQQIKKDFDVAIKVDSIA